MFAYTHPQHRSGGIRPWWPFAAAAVAAVVVVVVFIGSFMLGRASSDTPSASRTYHSLGVSGPAEDALVSTPWPYPVQGNRPNPITFPVPRSTSALGVATGFPRTPEGALAQLAAYTKAFAEANPDTAKQINAEWIIPGGPGGGDSVSALETKQQYGAVVTYLFHPAMGMIRGQSAGGDFVYACVLGTVTGTYAVNGYNKQYATTGCGRMWWVDGQWKIENKPANELAANNTPAAGSTTAYQSGWADLR